MTRWDAEAKARAAQEKTRSARPENEETLVNSEDGGNEEDQLPGTGTSPPYTPEPLAAYETREEEQTEHQGPQEQDPDERTGSGTDVEEKKKAKENKKREMTKDAMGKKAKKMSLDEAAKKNPVAGYFAGPLMGQPKKSTKSASSRSAAKKDSSAKEKKKEGRKKA